MNPTFSRLGYHPSVVKAPSAPSRCCLQNLVPVEHQQGVSEWGKGWGEGVITSKDRHTMKEKLMKREAKKRDPALQPGAAGSVPAEGLRHQLGV